MGELIGVDEAGEPTYVNETITPEVAQHYHDMYLRNRSIRKGKVAEYATAMEDNDWYLNGEGITFSWEPASCDCEPRHGMPLNGDHRFLACVRAGKPFRTLVTRGVDPEAFRVIDSTASRQFRDDLAILGVAWSSQSGGLIRKIAYWNLVAERDALERNVPLEQGRGGLAGLGSFHVSRQSLHELWATPNPRTGVEYGKEIAVSIQACSKWHNEFPGDRGALLFTHWLLTQQGNNPELVTRFFTIITFGSEDQHANNVLIKLTRMLNGQDVSHDRSLKMAGKRQETHVYWLLANWNRWVAMGRLPSFTLPGENGTLDNPFPQLRRVR